MVTNAMPTIYTPAFHRLVNLNYLSMEGVKALTAKHNLLFHVPTGYTTFPGPPTLEPYPNPQALGQSTSFDPVVYQM